MSLKTWINHPKRGEERSAGRVGWVEMSGVVCDRKIAAKMKGKVHMMVVRPNMMHDLEMVPLTKRQGTELEVAEAKMLTFSLGGVIASELNTSEGHRSIQVKCFGGWDDLDTRRIFDTFDLI